MNILRPEKAGVGYMADEALLSDLYKYIIRYDVKSFYASIDYQKLIELVRKHFDDLAQIHYLEATTTITVNRDGLIRLPHKGLPLRTTKSSLRGRGSSPLYS